MAAAIQSGAVEASHIHFTDARVVASQTYARDTRIRFFGCRCSQVLAPRVRRRNPAGGVLSKHSDRTIEQGLVRPQFRGVSRLSPILRVS